MAERYVNITLEEMDSLLKKENGWIRNRSGNEWIYDFHLKMLPVIIKVASSIRIDTGRARNKGSDAIRVYAVMKEGLGERDKIIRGLLRAKRVYRTTNWRENLQKLVMITLKKAKAICHKVMQK